MVRATLAGHVKMWVGTRPSRLALLGTAIPLLLAFFVFAHWTALTRSGYSPDEEISVFVVRGISSTGLPRLPSGLVYDRGLLFSYAAWASGQLFGDGLPSYRLPSLAGGLATTFLAALVGLRLGGSPVMAGLLAATAAWLVAASTWARFYALFVAVFLATVATLLNSLTGQARREGWFLAGLVAARLLHEMAVTLVALPLFFLLESPPGSEERRGARALLLRSLAVLTALQLLLIALAGGGSVFSAPELVGVAGGAPGVVFALLQLGSCMGWALLGLGGLGLGLLLRRLGASWPCCAIAAACAATLNLGLLLVGTIALMLVRPGRARVTCAAGVGLGLAMVAVWTVYVASYTPSGLGVAVASSLVRAGLAYPLAGATAMSDRWPLTTLAALGGIAASWRARNARSVAFVALALIVFMGAMDLGPRPRYLLAVLPLLFAMAAVLPLSLGRRLLFAPRLATAALAAVLAGSIIVEHEQGTREGSLEPTGPLGLASLRTSPFEQWTQEVKGHIEDGPVVCTDDLACLLVGQAPTHWWLNSEVEAATYGFHDASGWRSTYTGARILVGNEATAMACGELRGAWVIALPTLKHPLPPGIATAPGGPAGQAYPEAGRLTVLHEPEHWLGVRRTLSKEVIRCPNG